MQAFRNLFKNDLVLVGTNLTVVAGFATYLGTAHFLQSNSQYEARNVVLLTVVFYRISGDEEVGPHGGGAGGAHGRDRRNATRSYWADRGLARQDRRKAERWKAREIVQPEDEGREGRWKGPGKVGGAG